jgi:hypothetical protein
MQGTAMQVNVNGQEKSSQARQNRFSLQCWMFSRSRDPSYVRGWGSKGGQQKAKLQEHERAQTPIWLKYLTLHY